MLAILLWPIGAFSYHFVSPLPGRWNSLEHFGLSCFLYLMNDFTGQRSSSVNKEQHLNKKRWDYLFCQGKKERNEHDSIKNNLQIDSVWNERPWNVQTKRLISCLLLTTSTNQTVKSLIKGSHSSSSMLKLAKKIHKLRLHGGKNN